MPIVRVIGPSPDAGTAAGRVEALIESSGYEVVWCQRTGGDTAGPTGVKDRLSLDGLNACDILLVIDADESDPALLVALGAAGATGKPVIFLSADAQGGGGSWFEAVFKGEASRRIVWDEKYGPKLVEALGEFTEVQTPAPFRVRQQRSDVEGVLQELRRETRPHNVEVRGMPLTVLPGVLSPRLSHAPDALMRLWTVPHGADVLDLGCGSGVLGLAALASGAASLIALDINPQAVANTKLNLSDLNFGSRGEARLSDVYSALSEGEKFDLIIFAAPYWNRKPVDDLDRSCYDDDYRFFEAAIAGMPLLLRPKGHAYILFSDQGDVGRAIRIIENAGLKIANMHLQRPLKMGGHIRIVWDLRCPE